MKHQYFADKRDFVKYDLLLELMRHGHQQLTFLPMLTAADGRTDGSAVRYERGARDERLYGFLRNVLETNRRDIRLLRKFFAPCSFAYNAHDDDRVFTHDGRADHFARIPDDWLDRALVFLDPDNGIEVKSMSARTGHKYVLWDELASLRERMGGESTLLVYQHIPRRNRRVYFAELLALVRNRLEARDAILSDNIVAFLLIPGARGLHARTHQRLAAYAARHDLLFAADHSTRLTTYSSRGSFETENGRAPASEP